MHTAKGIGSLLRIYPLIFKNKNPSSVTAHHCPRDATTAEWRSESDKCNKFVDERCNLRFNTNEDSQEIRFAKPCIVPPRG